MYGWRDFGGEIPPIIRGLGINGACWESVGSIWPCMTASRKRKAAMIRYIIVPAASVLPGSRVRGLFASSPLQNYL